MFSISQKFVLLLAGFFLCLLAYSCSTTSHVIPESELYPLTMKEISTLWDYAVNLKEISEPETKEFEYIESSSNKTFSVSSTTRVYHFYVYTDENGKLLKPTESTALRKGRIGIGVTAICSGSCSNTGISSCTACDSECNNNCDTLPGCNQYDDCSTSLIGFSSRVIIW
ncbi:MAG: hypothetical protein JSW63_10775 [Ignavibacterium sp.]|nr:MAG: hypothetical protein JSW63_10775 [Ignavibacterium sp.]